MNSLVFTIKYFKENIMKKIISALILVVMLATCLLAAFPASAATKELTLAWNSFGYEAINEYGSVVPITDFANEITITKSATQLSAKRIGGNEARSYISTSQFAMTATTKYTYEVMVKNNTSLKYTGIPFAVDADGEVYFIYGSFENKNDSVGAPNATSAYMVPAKGKFDNKVLGGKSETDSIFFKKITVTDGFASLKFEYNGLDVKIYTKNSSGSYEQIGQTVSFSAGAKVAFGVHTRDAEGSYDRSATIKNGKITALNDEAVANLEPKVDNGADDLKIAISKAEAEHPEVNYTADSYAAFKTALTNAKTVADNKASTASDVEAAKTAIDTAISGLKAKSVDKSKLEAIIAKAEALKEKEWSTISYTMLMKAVKSAKELLQQSDLKQSDIDNTVATLQTRMDSLVAADGVVPETEEIPTVGEETDNNTVIESGAALESESASGDMGEVSPKKGCGSAVATTAIVATIVAGLGTALVIKKKD